jgi:hypothetical protein
MPPRRSARVAAVAAAVAERETALPPLPLSVVLHIFSLLPVDCRLRCTEVCRGWRSVLSERSLWTRLELTAESGVRVRAGFNPGAPWIALLRCAAARAGGGLQSLRIDAVTHEALLAVAAANAGALREVHVHTRDRQDDLGFNAAEVEALLVAAPLLRVLATDLISDDDTDIEAARRALRNEAPFGPLRVRRLCVYFRGDDEAGVAAFAGDVAGHASLAWLTLDSAPMNTPATLDAVVDAALARRLQSVTLNVCDLSPASAPALARLLSSDALTTLECWEMHLLDAPAARVLAAALRANSTLTSLTLNDVGVFDDAAAAAELLGALTGHASLRTLCLAFNHMHAANQAAVGAALGTLLAANAPALTELDVSECELGNAGLRALFKALPQNTHLRTLDCQDNDVSQAFTRDVLLPAVCANASLRSINTLGFGDAAADIARELRSRAPL